MTVISPLTADERAVLEIAAYGQPLAAIGRWEAPCESLVAKGYLERENRSNHWITQAGKDAWRDTEAADEADLRAALRKGMIATAPIGPTVVDGALFFKMPDGSSVACTCIGDPIASQIVRMWHGRS